MSVIQTCGSVPSGSDFINIFQPAEEGCVWTVLAPDVAASREATKINLQIQSETAGWPSEVCRRL